MTTEIDGHNHKLIKDQTEVTKKIKEKENNLQNNYGSHGYKINNIKNNKFNQNKKKQGNDERLKFNLDDADDVDFKENIKYNDFNENQIITNNNIKND